MTKERKKVFIIAGLALVFSIVVFSLAIAYMGGVRGIGLLGISFFLTAGVVVVLAQLIPASILFCMMIRSLFSSIRGSEMPIRAT
jgi:hypothetical protein